MHVHVHVHPHEWQSHQARKAPHLGPVPARVQPPRPCGRRRSARAIGGRRRAPRPCSPPALSAPQGLEEDRALSMQSPAPPKPWERSGCPVAPTAASTPGSTAVPSAAAQSPAAQTSVAGPSQPSYTAPGLGTQYGGLASRGYGGGGMYGGMNGGGMYGGGGGPFGAFGMNGQGDKDL